MISEEASAILRDEVAALWAKRSEIDVAIAAIEAILDGGAPGVLKVQLPEKVEKLPEEKGRRRGQEKYDWDKGKRMWQARLSNGQYHYTSKDIAKELGCSLAAVKNHMAKWPRRTASGRTRSKKDIPAGHTHIGLTKCPHCGAITSLNPCEMCHMKIAPGCIGEM